MDSNSFYAQTIQATSAYNALPTLIYDLLYFHKALFVHKIHVTDSTVDKKW